MFLEQSSRSGHYFPLPFIEKVWAEATISPLCCSREISIPELGLLSSFYITSSFSWIQTSCWLPHKHRINTTHQLQQSQHHRGERHREKCPPLTYFGGEGKFSLRLRQQQLYFSLAAMEIGQGTCSFPLQRSNKTTSTTRLLNTAEIYYLVLGCAGFAEKICFRFKAKFIRFASKNNFFTSLRFTVFISNKRCFIPYPEFWVFPILDPGSRIPDPWSQIFLVKQFFCTFSFRFDCFALLRLFPVHFCYRCLLFHLPPERDDFIIHFHTGWCARQTVCRKLFTWSYLKGG